MRVLRHVSVRPITVVVTIVCLVIPAVAKAFS